MRKRYNPFLRFYQKILSFFVEIDIGVYALSTPKIPTTEIYDFKCNDTIPTNKLQAEDFSCNVVCLKPPVVITEKTPSLLDNLNIRNCSKELEKSLLIKEEKMEFNLISRQYKTSLEKEFNYNKPEIQLSTNSHNFPKKDIHISHSLKTIEELLEIEPYTKKYPAKKISDIPIEKYPIKKEKFSQHQLELIKTKLAIQAKCKKYSMNLENIYDKFPTGLYDDIKIEKNGLISCKFAKNPQLGELQILATGKRKYDTQVTTAFIKTSELNL